MRNASPQPYGKMLTQHRPRRSYWSSGSGLLCGNYNEAASARPPHSARHERTHRDVFAKPSLLILKRAPVAVGPARVLVN